MFRVSPTTLDTLSLKGSLPYFGDQVVSIIWTNSPKGPFWILGSLFICQGPYFSVLAKSTQKCPFYLHTYIQLRDTLCL